MFSEKKLIANIKSFIRIFDYHNAVFQLFYLGESYRIFIGVFLYENKEYVRSIAFLKTLPDSPTKYFYLILNYIEIAEKGSARKNIEILESLTDFPVDETVDEFFLPYYFTEDLLPHLNELKVGLEINNKEGKINNLKLALRNDSFTALYELFRNNIELNLSDVNEILQPLYKNSIVNMDILRSETNPYKLAFLSKKYYDKKMYKETATIHKHIIEKFYGFTLFVEYFGISLYRLEKRCCLEKLGKYLMRNYQNNNMTYFIVGLYYKSRFSSVNAILAFKKSIVLKTDPIVFLALSHEYKQIGNYDGHRKYKQLAKYFAINNN